MKIQNNLMRSFLCVGRNAPIVALLGDLGWLPITTITKISCIGFWFRLSKMAEGRLNKQIFIEASNLASDKGYIGLPISMTFLKTTTPMNIQHQHYASREAEAMLLQR